MNSTLPVIKATLPFLIGILGARTNVLLIIKVNMTPMLIK